MYTVVALAQVNCRKKTTSCVAVARVTEATTTALQQGCFAKDLDRSWASSLIKVHILGRKWLECSLCSTPGRKQWHCQKTTKIELLADIVIYCLYSPGNVQNTKVLVTWKAVKPFFAKTFHFVMLLRLFIDLYEIEALCHFLVFKNNHKKISW